MKKNIPPLQFDTFYHIFNRGIDRTNIFFEESNYEFFLRKYVKYVSPIASTFAYSLLKNHFHFLIRIRSEQSIASNISRNNSSDPCELISRQFSHFFNSYAQAINKGYQRSGGLFETPFRRIPVDDNRYLAQLIYYIHFNAQKHRFVEDFSTYKHCSYPIYLRRGKTFLERKTGIEWFGDREQFVRKHREWSDNIFTDDLLFPEFDQSNFLAGISRSLSPTPDLHK